MYTVYPIEHLRSMIHLTKGNKWNLLRKITTYKDHWVMLMSSSKYQTVTITLRLEVYDIIKQSYTKQK